MSWLQRRANPRGQDFDNCIIRVLCMQAARVCLCAPCVPSWHCWLELFVALFTCARETGLKRLGRAARGGGGGSICFLCNQHMFLRALPQMLTAHATQTVDNHKVDLPSRHIIIPLIEEVDHCTCTISKKWFFLLFTVVAGRRRKRNKAVLV